MLDIPYYKLNFEDDFQTYVVDYLCDEYARGRTPNPCIACNREIKFRSLLNKAFSLGMDYLATGHLAKIEYLEDTYSLAKGNDPIKEQSYFLYTLGQNELQHLLFPLGEYPKSKVRSMAAERGLPVADKPKSQDLCFIYDDGYREFIRKYVPLTKGDIFSTEGKLLGIHDGIALYTIGQRCGLGLAAGKRLYVISIDPDSNTLVVDSDDKLFSNQLFAKNVTYVSGKTLEQPTPIYAKIRYRSPEAEAVIYPNGETAEIRFTLPQRAITPGQAVVFYDGEKVIGGGIIESSIKDCPIPS
jgi:tRNA-specific 2-thiouridylase